MLNSHLGLWHARLCERVYHWFFSRIYPSLPLFAGNVFEFVVGGLLLESLVYFPDSPVDQSAERDAEL